MDKILETIVSWLWGWPLIFTVLFVGVYFTIGSKFFQIGYLPHIFKATFGKLFSKKDKVESDKGVLTPFQAVSTAIGGSVGVGNIGGVATAIAVGGPGAVFWMWITALLGMMTKTVEVTLAVHYRSTDEKGNPYGGPTYYMEKGLGEEMKFKFWKIPAILFGFGIFTTFFITLQNYTVSEAVSSTFNIGMIPSSLIYVTLIYVIIYGGIKRIGEIATKLIPFMCIFYVVASLFIIFKNYSEIIPVFALIFDSAFTGMAAVGGFTGAVIAQVIRMGVARAVYSNEAGWGTSPMIHSTAKTNHPIKQGMWGAVEVFVDTIIVCSMTAFTIIITGVWSSGLDGASLTLSAFEVGIGEVGRYIIALSVFLFGLTTTTGWYTYYEIILRHLFGGEKKVDVKNKTIFFYKWLYPIPGLLMVVYAVYYDLPGKAVWYFADITTAIPTFINLIVIMVLSKKFFELLRDYKARHLNIGTIDSHFNVFYEDKLKK
ncbi:sodium:alanine symporter family protein [Sporosarcina sp. ACRSL]|uniref:alanine/glycine:cation symporter family protein n=1 Tax=Sporosarcina sp. ACRSL TaxID=2918215 RepID=UPI001EF607F5|nr:sodium:alanine symporter family protein [Sporosarcina sp. ACRSL]MCG7344597.1 sodium:alanine symporter family protein [Sporosarcina sp. ACRSL]